LAKGLLGVMLFIIGAIGLAFFAEYNGRMISYPLLFELLSIGIILLGAYLYITSKIKRRIIVDSDALQKIAELKSKGEKIILNFDDCEFKGNDYQEELQDESSLRSDDVLFNQTSRVNILEITQSALIYCHHSGERKEWFKSQTFPFDEAGLRMLVMKGRLILYVDGFDREKYFFELA
jgi:hypothetical protein